MEIMIVSHSSRRTQAWDLADSLNADIVLEDDGFLGARGNHLRALDLATKQYARTIILEDDAIPCYAFRDRAQLWLDRYPDDLISFYLGTGKPQAFQPVIAQKLERLDGDHITMPALMHGVAYSFPTGSIPDVLSRLNRWRQIDGALGDAWMDLTGREVIYPVPSLVDHADGPSVINRSQQLVRKAWRFLDADATAGHAVAAQEP